MEKNKQFSGAAKGRSRVPMDKNDELRWLFLEASTSALETWAEALSSKLEGIEITSPPREFLCMAVAKESLAEQAFCLGEVLFTECEVLYQGRRFIGRALCDEPLRSLTSALLEAALHLALNVLDEMERAFSEEKMRIAQEKERTSRALGSTRVRFETMRPT